MRSRFVATEWRVRVYRINAVGRDGTAVVLGPFDRASDAIVHLRDAFADYPRAWVTNEGDMDVSLADLERMAGDELNRSGDA